MSRYQDLILRAKMAKLFFWTERREQSVKEGVFHSSSTPGMAVRPYLIPKFF